MIDPYHQWLGIPPAEQPPNHYRLLALSLFESDPGVIESAADQRMAHLRTFQTSKYNELAERLLNEISAAKICLLKPDRKAKYDALLRSGVAVPQAVELPRAMPVQQPRSPVFQAAPLPVQPMPVQQPQPAVVLVAPSFHSAPPPPPATVGAAPAPASVPIYDMVSEPQIRPLPVRRSTTKKSNNNLALIVLGPVVGIVVVALVLILRTPDDDPDQQPKKPQHAAGAPSYPYSTAPKTQPVLPGITSRVQPPDPFRTAPQSQPPDPFKSVQPPQPPRHPSFASLVSLADPIFADFSDSFHDYQDVLTLIKSPDLSKWQPKKEPVPPITLTFEEKVSRIDNRDIPNDEQLVTVPIGFLPSKADLHISVYSGVSEPATKVVLQEKPEAVTVSFSVSRGKSGSAVIHVKPWLGPPEGKNSIPCTIGRLQTLFANLPGITDNENAGIQNTQQLIQNLEQQRQDLQNTSVDASQVGAKGAALTAINGHLTTQYGKLRTLQNALDRDTAKLTELPDIIKQVGTFVGTTVEFRIYYVVDKHDITVVQSDEYAPDKSETVQKK